MITSQNVKTKVSLLICLYDAQKCISKENNRILYIIDETSFREWESAIMSCEDDFKVLITEPYFLKFSVFLNLYEDGVETEVTLMCRSELLG